MYENKHDYDTPEQIRECLECKAHPDCTNCVKYRPRNKPKGTRGGNRKGCAIIAKDKGGNIVNWYGSLEAASRATGISTYRIRLALKREWAIDGYFYSKGVVNG